MIENEKIETGDILLIHTEKFLAKAIQWFMKIWGKEKKLDTSWIGNHAATFLVDDPIRIGESVDNGFRINIFNKKYDFDKSNYVVLTPKVTYTTCEEKIIKDYIFELQTVSKTYQYWNFIQWPIYILSFGKISLFGSGKDRGITYCYESTARIMKHVRPNNVDWNVEKTDFFSLYNNPNFKIKIDKRCLTN